MSAQPAAWYRRIEPRHHRLRCAGRAQRRPHRPLSGQGQRSGAARFGRTGRRGAADLPRRRGTRDRAGRSHLAGGRHRSRARRRAAVHRAARRPRRRRHRRAPRRGRCRGHPGRGPARRPCAGLVFGVDLAARDTATVGGMASTNAGGLRTVRYGNMGEQVDRFAGRAARRFAAAPAQPGAQRQHRLRPAGAVRRRRRHPRRHHRAGSAATPQPVASGDGGLRIRRSRCARRRRAGRFATWTVSPRWS